MILNGSANADLNGVVYKLVSGDVIGLSYFSNMLGFEYYGDIVAN